MKKRVLLICIISLNVLPAAQIPHSKHVGIIVLENVSASEVYGNPVMPFFNSLVWRYASVAKYTTCCHGSLSNYFRLTAGRGITVDQYVSSVSNDNIFRHLLNARKTFKSYEESIPYVGDVIDVIVWPYLKRHDPEAYFSDIFNSSMQQQTIVPFSQFASDLAAGTLPEYFFITPNAINDVHSCPTSDPCTLNDRLARADKWLAANIGPYLQSSTFRAGDLLIITADESDLAESANAFLPAVVMSATVKSGYRSLNSFNHYSTLRTMMEDLWLTPNLGAASTANNLAELFTTEPRPCVVFSPPTTIVAATVTADSSCSTGSISQRAVNWGDGTFQIVSRSTLKLHHSYTAPGTYTAYLRLRDAALNKFWSSRTKISVE